MFTLSLDTSARESMGCKRRVSNVNVLKKKKTNYSSGTIWILGSKNMPSLSVSKLEPTFIVYQASHKTHIVSLKT